MKRRVVVTGLGIVSPIGCVKDIFWDNLVKGKSGIGPLTHFDATQYDSRIAGEVKEFAPHPSISTKELRRMERFVQFGVTAAKNAMEDSGIDMSREDPYRIGVLVGSGIGSLRIIEEEHKVILEKGPSRVTPFLIPMLIVNMASGHISIMTGVKGPNLCTTTACASGSHAMGEAMRIIQYGDADIMIAGGTESCISALGIGGFCALKALSTRNDEPQKASRPFDKDRDGFVMSEGCGIAILEELEHAKKRNAKIYGEIVGYGMTGDAYHMTAPDPEGEGATRCMVNALKDGNLKPEDISYINAHGTSTSLNDKIETLAIKKAFGSSAKKIPVSSTKSMLGHQLGAAGAIEFIICCLAMEKSIIPPTINYETPDPDCDLDYVPNKARQAKVNACLSNSLGFGGHNATLCVKKF
ncbi:MAG: beta-ketoacyl-[acyl-carrier-protein] synthase II [Candidatus Omnitrophica bacterium CG_4_9_14_0_2_um_filter_42_8]|nr:MAG: beta-ketoacyl-[acyl-carrier-protein] synthase II [Candidatus Omnitrophica bacterium CG22_combo_CG10-13_8_21_14_all_43_16]PJC47163.1 MAG: beta-ketoacyl-[acyl-carrier-protein] synthase II [Candidatus Omnitrophica bacterium CG_4_9_14_0_2_um_filter_42_8]